MKKIISVATILMWIIAIYTFVKAYLAHNLLSLLPIYAYNCPQGLFGWSLCLAIVLSIIRIVLIAIKRK